jgi:hypothetical protein
VEAAPPAASAPSAAPSAGAAPAKRVAISAYAWPEEAGPEPKEADWAGATPLENDTPGAARPDTTSPHCQEAAIGAWVRVTCTPGVKHFGAVWSLAGDTAKAKARFSLASELEHFEKAPQSIGEDMERKMGDLVTVTFPVSPGSATLLRVDGISWEEEYEGSLVLTRAGPMVDVTWALGEKHPSILYR